ncbi:acetylxylan esterase [Cellulomonas marina]|uniref:Acetyl xylan esterase (AXE1) n=1 Tax=Cellulomonas marina TaxID=988821 RepID=A0A1I0YYC0_9CELL|nr:acetylxylan esterase [Cellulomonas marina]GIG28111.1 hypothetical protein Cma02nite_07110 [Cellulomonas marina]SFB18354.1 Acetyl xylan esterase (AXE1) [Cellulomonas marina]
MSVALPPDPLAGYEDWPGWARSTPPRTTGDARQDALAAVLGVRALPAGPPAVEVLATRTTPDGLRLAELVWSTGVGPRTHGWLVRPDDDAARPGVLALHCHGGVKSVGGAQLVELGDDAPAGAVRLQRDLYGGRGPAHALARAGCAVLAPDAFCWGSRRFPLTERSARLAGGVAALEARWAAEGHDPDDDQRYDAVSGLHEDTVAKAAGVLGTSLAGMVARDDLVALDVLAALPGVDAGRLGAFGFSGGGGRSVLLAALDERVRAHVVTGMMATFASLVPRYLDTHSWLLMSPGLWGLSEWPDLLPPLPGRSLLVQYGRQDALFPLDGQRAADERLAAAWAGTGRYTGAWWDRPHVFDAPMQDEAFAFLAGALGAGTPA